MRARTLLSLAGILAFTACDGEPGKDGAQGSSGEAGATGAAGAAGPDGNSGPDGVDGNSGSDGTNASELDEDGDGVLAPDDCDDADASVGAPAELFLDYDGDGFGEPMITQFTCYSPAGWVTNSDDCDDLNDAINPDATEICNEGIDDNCDGLADDDDSSTDLSTGNAYWVDSDGDGYGDETVAMVDACAEYSGITAVGGDCDDTEAAINPAAEEICNNGIDDNCNNSADTCVLGEELTEADADVSLIGDSYNDTFGRDFAVGDIDADGFDDIVVGAYANDDGGTSSGKVYVHMGAATASDMETSASEITGSTSYMYLGHDVAMVDFNNDSYDDVVVSAYYVDEAYIFYGSATGLSASLEDTDADVTMSGSAGYHFGHDVEPIADWDGDGLADLLVTDFGNYSYTSYAYIVSGSTSASSALDVDGGDYTTRITCDAGNVGDYLGWRDAVGSGDFNGDGYSDLGLGEYSNDDAGSSYGKAYVFLGTSSSSDWFTADANTTISTNNASDYGYFGYDVSSIRDHNGDGYDELIVGAYYMDSSTSASVGAAYIYFGAATGWASAIEHDSADISIEGEVAYDQLGRSVAGLDDMDADGNGDFAVGARFYDGPTGAISSSGGAFIFFSDTTSDGGSFVSSDADAVVYSSSTTSYLGDEVSSGDFNNDGNTDLVVGADSYSSTGWMGVFLGQGI